MEQKQQSPCVIMGREILSFLCAEKLPLFVAGWDSKHLERQTCLTVSLSTFLLIS